MSAEETLCAAIRVALEPLALNAVYAANPARAREPFAVVEAGMSADWSTKDRRGRELRPAISIVTAAEDPAVLQALLADAADAVEAMSPAQAGWGIASCILLRARHAREREGRWRGLVEFRVRMMEDL